MSDFVYQNWQEIVGALLGFLFLFFELKAHKAMFPAGILMSAFYVGVYVDARFYALALINVYFIVAQAYAWFRWNSETTSKPLQLRHATWKTGLSAFAMGGVLFFLLWWLLLQVPQQSVVAWGDALVTTLSIIAIGMLAFRYVEQWLPLIAANALSVYLFFQQQMYPTTLLYVVYLGASFWGYFRWRAIAKR